MIGRHMEDHAASVLAAIRESGLYKEERVLETPQGSDVAVSGREVLNFCANNYLGLSSHPALLRAAHDAIDRWGFGLSSVRFICGTQAVHKELEREISRFLGFDDTILFSSCFDANGALFEPLLGPEDAIVSDELNHASIIDGIRLCKAKRFRFRHSDMNDLEDKLKEAKSARFRMIVSDGVFSMDGDVAKLPEICELAERYDALVAIDECHATGHLGETGRGSIELKGVQGRVDIVTSTLGKALGGASGGFISTRADIVKLLRQRGRPYLFSNTLMPAIVGASLVAFRLLAESNALVVKLRENTERFRSGMTEAGFDLKAGETPIVPVMLYDAPLAQEFAARMLDEGVYVVGFCYPVVPRGQARIRVQLSAAHTDEQVDRAVGAFIRVGRDLGVLPTAR